MRCEKQEAGSEAAAVRVGNMGGAEEEAGSGEE